MPNPNPDTDTASATSAESMIKNAFGGPAAPAEPTKGGERSQEAGTTGGGSAPTEGGTGTPAGEPAPPKAPVGDKETDTSEEGDPTPESDTPEYWYEGETSRYRTPEDAQKGIAEKDGYIARLVDENKALRDKALLADRLQKLVKPDALNEQRIMDHLPDEYKGVSESDFEGDDESLRKYLRARMNAEVLVEKEDRAAAEQAEAEAKKEAAALDNADAFIEKTVTPEFFEATNPEDAARLVSMLDKKGDAGHSPLDQARWIAAYIGQDAANRYLTGLKSEFWNGRRSAIQKIVKTVETEPARPVDPAPPGPPRRKTAREMITAGLTTTAKPR